MKDWILSFVKNLDPNRESWLGLAPGTKPNWPIYGEEADVLLVGEEGGIDAVADADVNQRCDFWKGQSMVTRI